ncbi:MAG: PAS domain-containing sensor histidine kinase [Gaiellales bacterium]
MDTSDERPDRREAVRWISPRVRELTGYTQQEWLAGELWESVLHPDDRDRVIASHEEFLKGAGDRWECEYRLVTRTSDSIWVRDVETVVRSSEGRPVQRQGSMEDITQRVEAQGRLRRSEQLYRLLAESVPDAGFALFDRELRYTLAAGQVFQAAGADPTQLEGRRLGSTGDNPEEVHRLRGAVTGALHGETAELDLSLSGRWVRAHVAPVTADGDVVGALVMSLDVTERNAAEAALRDSEARREQVLAAMLRAEDEQRARIAVDLHDDTVQVMTAALLSLDRVTEAIGRGESETAISAAAGYRAALAQAMERTRRLMFELRPPTLITSGLAAALDDLLDEAARESGFSPHLDCSRARFGDTTESLVYRAMAEGVANVRKHAAAANVWLICREAGARLEVCLRDDGCGFDPNQPGDAARRRLHLGLDSIAERVRLAGGQFTIHSTPGMGTRLLLSLPLT